MNYSEIFESEYKRLNEAQKQAVETIYWPVMVVAGPWTGKTQIIWLRTANIILKAWINPENILITTFTEAWVVAIRERLARFLWNEAYKVNVSTIHSFSQEVIKTFPEKFIEYKAGTPIDEVEALEILKKIIDELYEKERLEALVTSYDKYFYLRDISMRINNLKQEGVSLARLKKLTEKQAEIYKEELAEIKPTLKKYATTQEKQEKHIKKLEELYEIFSEYNATLRYLNKYDFSDMINFVLEKIQTDNELKHHYAEQFQFIMLDEYQDTNNAQNMIIDQILSVTDELPNIMTVWDDDQSIYRFQGANIENMLDFSTKYPETQFVVLENNYRSTQPILDLSSQLIDNNNERLSKKIESIDKKLISSGGYKDILDLPKLFRAASDIEERQFVLENIKKLLEEWVSANEISVIVRGNREVKDWTSLLLQNEIEAESKLKTDILKSNYIDFIIKYLELIENPFANENALIDIMRSKLVDIHPIDLLTINRALYIENYSKKIKTTMIDFLLDEEKMNNTALRNKNSLIQFRDFIINSSQNLWTTSFVEFFNTFIEETNILQFVEIQGNFDDIEDIYTLFNKIKDWNTVDNEFNITKLLSKLSLYKEYNFAIPRQILKKHTNWVQVLTAHGSKGLEYDYVFIPGLYTWNWEWKRVIDRLKLPTGIAWDWLQWESFAQIEEDRRLFFVAATRARKSLILSYPAGIWTKPLLQSSFVEEIIWKFEEIEFIWENNSCTEMIENDLKWQLIEYSDVEFDYISEFLENYKLSPSDFNLFLDDPFAFLQRVVYKYPFLDNKFTIFGKVYHRTLELFYLKYKSEGKLPEKDYLTSTFSMLLKSEILTPDENKELITKWIEWLEWYYDLYKSSSREPLLLEYSLRRKNITWENIPLTGTIDKIEKVWISNNSSENQGWQMAFFKDSVALVDYKTWSAKSLWQIKGTDRYGNKKDDLSEWKYFRQLMFYKLLCENDTEFMNTFEIGSLALDFVEWKKWNYKFVEVDVSEEEFEDFKNLLLEAWSKISDISYWRELLQK